MLTDREFQLFKGYEKGKTLNEEDENIIYNFTSIGLANIGISRLEDKSRETAILTPLGLNIFKREKIMRNPFKKFFYQLVNI